jgi:Cu/Ag efflux protein CusF
MDKKILIILLIIVSLVLFTAGLSLGIFYQKQKDAPKVDAAKIILEKLSSKTVPSIAIYGKVTKIDGKNITLTFAGDTMTVNIKDGSNIYSFRGSGGTSGNVPVQQDAKFEDIKVGDNLNATMKVLADGQLESQSVIILPN